MIRRVWKHISLYNRWRKNCLNGKMHKIAVLFGAKSPTFEFMKQFERPFELVVDLNSTVKGEEK